MVHKGKLSMLDDSVHAVAIKTIKCECYNHTAVYNIVFVSTYSVNYSYFVVFIAQGNAFYTISLFSFLNC